MNERTITGVIGVLVVVAVTVLGVATFLQTYLLDASAGAQQIPTFAVLAIVILFTFALFALGAKSDRWMRNPYW